jgi:hypothetical protein
MKKSVLAILLILSASAWAQDTRLKPGLWEVKILHQVVDGRDMSGQIASAQDKAREAMANMSPEQRKQMEAMMGGRSMPTMGADGATRICVSAAMAAKDRTVADPQGRCAPAKVDHSGNTVSFEFSCTTNGRSSVGKGKSTVSGDTVSTSVEATTTDAKGQHTMQSETRMTYLGADCQGVKPADELAQGNRAPAQ